MRASRWEIKCQLEDDVNIPDCLADEDVVNRMRLPETVAVAPDAVPVKVKVAVPPDVGGGAILLCPPATRLSSSSVSSMMFAMSSTPKQLRVGDAE